MTYSSGEIRNGDNDSGGGIGEEDVYRGNREKLVLAPLSDSHLELEAILVSVSKFSSCPTLHCLLTTSTTNYCLKEDVNDFDLKGLFYSKQDLKNACCSLV